ncbi:HTH-type transcriptional regulator uidR [Beauveria bassiana D1-5]|uniref:HTH-type transcriptional regulator uidR n=1 Tax=Beauveria bassiana D1-5 TaxID=1245745 RepID=A0A0A2VU73_BEABA|nr:TetR family transcriptional regulator [Klebsiella michiganensis]KGQ11476.1 HTH-type transcriptional regulator uidR [Beauveria bassiana D1-5]
MSSKLEARHKARQNDIIAAARRCFTSSGFHAASMSQIATEAQLSVGQIYRYFSNKDAIIEAIIHRIIDKRIADMSDKSPTDIIPNLLASRISLNEEDDTLMLEISAEATRNPQVAAWLAEADERIFKTACLHLKKDHPHLTEERVRCSVEVTAVMMEGTIYRRLTSQKVEPQAMEKVYREIINMLIGIN